MYVPPCDRRQNNHRRSYSTPNATVNPRKRSNSTIVPHHLLSSNTHHLHLAAPAVVDLTRLNSPSLASFTPYSESIDSQGPARGSLRAHMHARSHSLSSILTGAKGIEVPAPPQRRRLLSLFEVGSADTYRAASPSSESPCSSSPPPSPSMSIPSISRTHSTTTSSSLPQTPPLPLTPLCARQQSKCTSKKMNRETMLVTGGRKRAPSLPVSPVHWTRDSSSSCERMCERPFSAFGRNNAARLDRITTTQPHSPEIPRSNSPTSPQSLTALESSSKFMRTLTFCAVCGASGPDFPRCPKCGDAWCSRACRMTARQENGSDRDGVRGHGCKGIRTP